MDGHFQRPCLGSPRAAGAWRNHVAAFVVTAIASVFSFQGATAQQLLEQSAALDSVLLSKLAKRGDLTLRDATLAEALMAISEIWQINLVVGQEMPGHVSGQFKQVTLQEILDSILLANGYSYRPLGQGLVVFRLDEADGVNPLFEVATIPLRNVDPADVLAGAKLLSSPKGKVEVIVSARSLLAIDFPDRVMMIRSLVRDVDVPGASQWTGEMTADGQFQVAQFALQFIDAEKAKESCQQVLSEVGKVAVLHGANRLVLADTPIRIALARQLIEQIDVPRPQVRIMALIYDLSLEDIEALGFNWGHAIEFRHDDAGTAGTSLGIESVTQIPPVAGGLGSAMTFVNLSRHLDINSIITALDEANDSRLLADPHVAVEDHEVAEIKIVTEIPYQQLTQTQQGGNIGTTAFREAGITLKVTPHIANDGTIQMNVNPMFSRLTGFTPGDQPAPIIDSREAKTTVRVADRQTLVIGGLRQRTDTGDFNGIPYLKDIKWIGTLFRSKETTVRESELVVFLTPEIVMPGDCGRPRQGAAFDAGQLLLDGVPPADVRSAFGSPHSDAEGESVEDLPSPPPDAQPPSEPAASRNRPAKSSPRRATSSATGSSAARDRGGKSPIKTAHNTLVGRIFQR